MLTLLMLLVGGYLIGSIPFGYLTAWLVAGIDIRQHGSGNVGATNVGRVLGWKWFPPVFVLDLAKGLAPVAWLAYGNRPALEGGLARADVAALVGLAVILGHLYPVWLGWRGGKGVATGAGVVAILAPMPAVGAALAWFFVFIPLRYVSLASMVAAVVLAAGQVILAGPNAFAPEQRAATLLCCLASVLVVVRHRSNLQRLLAGTEPKVRLKKVALGTAQNTDGGHVGPPSS
jgi:glycerol-3-phosphate acyltransferase PlsY